MENKDLFLKFFQKPLVEFSQIKILSPEEHVKLCPLPILGPTTEGCLKQTMEKRGREFDDLYTLYSFMIYLIVIEGRELISHTIKVHGFFYIRSLEALKALSWSLVDIKAGAYYNATQMLRYAFEAIIQAAYLEEQNKGISKILKEAEKLEKRYKSFSRRYIEDLWLLRDKSRELQEFYNELSSYTHPTYSEFKKIIQKPQQLIFNTFDIKYYDRCHKFFIKICDIILLMYIRKIPRIVESAFKGKFLRTIMPSYNLQKWYKFIKRTLPWAGNELEKKRLI
ncbi:MAG: hypothetical protein QXJ20_02090 [Candidatus Aenigmatarchaeota archaeon]